jgi:thymidylate synthase (FAD)
MSSSYIGDEEYTDLMEPVDYSDADLEAVKELKSHNFPRSEQYWIDEAKTRAFLRKEASRGHWGIWEHPSIGFAVENMSVVTERQVTRHRHLSFDIQSMRYVDFTDSSDFAMPASLTDPDHKTRGEGLIWYDMESETPLDEQDPDVESMDEAHEIYEEALDKASESYNAMRGLGVPKEDARYALPLGTQVNVGMSGNARSFLHVLNLRSRGDAQWEIQDLSDDIVAELGEWIPYTTEWWDEKGPVQISP